MWPRAHFENMAATVEEKDVEVSTKGRENGDVGELHRKGRERVGA